jgi:O-antigen/teichoic acid export membrane protein
MPITPLPEVETGKVVVEVSEVEQKAIGLLRFIPGFGRLSASHRVMTAMRGSAWVMVGYGASQLLRLASTIVLARILVPQAFGLVALVNVFLSGLEMLSDLGVGTDVIQHQRGDEPVFVNTAFLIQVVRGSIIWVVATAFAYPFAHFYHQPALIALVMVGSVSVLFRGLTSSSIWSLTRQVRLGRVTLLNIGSDFFGFVVALIWAIVSPSAWALVAGRVAAMAALMVASHLIAEHPVSMKWDSKAAREILAFGAGMFLSTSTYFIGGEAERLVVGKFITLVELGCFSLALSISSAAGKGLQQVVTQVFFPMISASIRQDRDRAIEHFKRARHLVLIMSACLSLAFIAGSHLAVKVLLGSKYEMAGWMLQLLGVRAALELFMSVTVSMLFALGTSRYAAIGNVLKLMFLGIGLVIAFTRFGFHEALWVLTLAPLANYIPFLFGLRQHCRAVLRTELESFGAFAAITASTAVIARFI